MRCQLPGCTTPADDVLRVWITVDGKRHRIDMCADDRAGLLDDLLAWAVPAKPDAPTGRARSAVVVTDPAEVERKKEPPDRGVNRIGGPGGSSTSD